MQLTKYTHACLVLKHNDIKIVFDPGGFSTDFSDFTQIDAVIITHEHPDHVNIDTVKEIITSNPELLICTTKAVQESLKDHAIEAQAMMPGERVMLNDVSLQFVGGTHAQIYDDVPAIDNLGVIVDDTLFVPGDSYFVPEQKVDWLALPLNAPWATIQQTVEFVKSVVPKHIFPVHDGLLSEVGHQIYGGNVQSHMPEGTTYQRIQLGETISLA